MISLFQVWQEETKTPIITTKYDNTYLTGGCWSPSRPGSYPAPDFVVSASLLLTFLSWFVGVFFTTKADGNMDVWDMYHKQNDPIFSSKV